MGRKTSDGNLPLTKISVIELKHEELISGFRFGEGGALQKVVFTLRPLAPFRLDLTAWTLRRCPDNLIDRWDGQTYRRVLALHNQPVEISVVQSGPPANPEIVVTVIGKRLEAGETERQVTAALEKMLGLNVDLTEFYRFAEGDGRLGPLVRPFVGLKPPRLPSIFETLVNGISCQQITLTLCIRLLNRIAGAYGLAIKGEGELGHAFPMAEDLANLEPEELREMQFSMQKGRAVVELARGVLDGLDLEAIGDLDDEQAASQLMELRGVGRWTAEYVLLRGFGRTHIFPGDDVGARNNLRRWLAVPVPLDYEGVRQVMKAFDPYGGLVYFHLLLNNLARAGYVTTNAE